MNHTRQRAVNHSLPPNQDRGRMPLKVSINNNITIKTGPKTGGGLTVMPPRIKTGGVLTVMPPRTNNTGAKTVAGLHNTGAQMVAGLHTILICSPSPTQNVSCPGWNPGTPLMFAKTLSM